VISSDDRTATEWLTIIAHEHPAHFLASFWAALVKANDEDYLIIRPALMNLKRKYANLHGREVP
jgi:hypothetical protein